MRIAILTHLYLPNNCSGSETSIHAVAVFLKSRGQDVRVINLGLGPSSYYIYEGIEVFGKGNDLDGQARWANVLFSQLYHTGDNILLAHRIKKPIVHFIHNETAGYNHKINLLWDRNYVVYNSESNRRVWNFNLPYFILNPALDPQKYNTGENPIFNEYITLINLNANKGGHILQRIAERMPKDSFLAVKGDYDFQNEPHLPNVQVVEKQVDMLEVYKRTRILLMPSQYESWGKTATEAMCSGIPIVCTRTPGLEDNCREAGIYVEDRTSIEEWVEKISLLDADPFYYSEVGEKGKRRIEELNFPKQLLDFEQFLYNIIS